MNGYKTQIIYGKARILLDGSDGMGVHVILSGEALRQMNGDVLKLLDFVLFHGGQVSRIDLALDDISGELTLARVKRAVRAGAVSCKATYYRHMQSGKISTGEVTGETFYFGSAQSRTQYRIYDKAAEQGISGHWIRCEGQYRNENANQVAMMIRDAGLEIGSIYCGLLRGYLNFLKPSKTDTNKSRWKVATWWFNLLQGADKLKLSVQKAEPTMKRKKEYFTKQCAPTMAMLFKYYGPEEMTDIMVNGMNRLTSDQRELCTIPF
jgi:DNA relaxase NicK